MSPSNIAEFWEWFTANERRFRILDVSKKEQLLSELLEQLHDCSPHLFFQLGGAPRGPAELIITAQGHLEHFPVVSQLIAKAPSLPDWQFIAFIPAAGFDFVTTYEGVTVSPKECWFIPLTSRARPHSLAIRVGIPDYDDSQSATFAKAIDVVLNTGLGERAAGWELDHVEVGPLPIAPEESGYIELSELADYIEFWTRNRTSGHA